MARLPDPQNIQGHRVSYSSEKKGTAIRIEINEGERQMAEYKNSFVWEQKLKWDKIEWRWDSLSDSQKCVIVSDLYYTPMEYVSKTLLYKCYQWLLTGLKMDRLEIRGDAENLRLVKWQKIEENEDGHTD